MIFLMISTLIGLVSLQYFSLNYSIQGLNRAIIFTPIELMYKCVTFQGESPQFDKDDFEHIVLDYYSHYYLDIQVVMKWTFITTIP